MLNLHLLECTVKGYDHISDLLLAKYWVITGCKYCSCYALNEIYCYATTPPTCDYYDVFYDCNLNNAILYVPKGCKSVYKSTTVWNSFDNIIEMD